MSDQFELPLFNHQPVERSAELTRVFLGWDRPLLNLAVHHLTRNWTGQTLDLSHQLVVVPTRQAGRRLRSSLALHASSRNAAVLPPAVVTPDHLLSAECLPHLESVVASRAELLVAWADVLLSANLADFRSVFPVEPEERNLSWALRTAEDLLRVQSLLGETGLTIQSGGRILADEGLEPQRWVELSRLERLAESILAKRKRLSPEVVRAQAAREGVLADHVDTIILLGVPDPPPLLCPALLHHAGSIRCEVVIHAPESLSASFDEFGRPCPHDWIERPIDLPDLETTLHQAANPQAQAEYVTALFEETQDLAAVAAIGVPDAELLPPLEESFASRGQATFNPAGQSASCQALTTFLRTLHRLAVSQSFLSFLELLRIPGAARAASNWEASKDRPEFTAVEILAALDAFQREHVPDSLDSAQRINKTCARSSPALTRSLSWINSWLRRLEREPLWDALPRFLAEIYAGTEFDPAQPRDEAFSATANLLHAFLDALEAGLISHLPQAQTFADGLRLLLHLLEKETIYHDHKADALDLQGWLELPWEDAPHLVVTGMNEGSVPESVQGHAYLPNTARRLLGIRSNEERHARDAYILSSLLACRSEGGRIDLVFGQRSSSEEPLRPSRLLFACPPGELAQRVRTLFHGEVPAREAPAWSLAWQLTPPAPDDSMRIFERLPVTAFRDYLQCPFRFYLRRGLRMERDDGPLAELDARHFGTLCHIVLEEFAAHPVSQSEREEEVAQFFEDTLHAIIAREYGDHLPVPVLIQQESARQRLQWWATIETEQRRCGWEIVESERELSFEPHPSAGIRITGKIDRIERNTESGVIRVLDFKTGRLKSPSDAHLRNLRRDEDPARLPAWTLVQKGKRFKRWIDLQLPLYLLELKRAEPEAAIVTGYANLGRAKSEVALEVWEDLETDLAAAQACVEGVLTSVAQRHFWPPSERVDYDDFQQILLADPVRTVNPENLVTS